MKFVTSSLRKHRMDRAARRAISEGQTVILITDLDELGGLTGGILRDTFRQSYPDYPHVKVVDRRSVPSSIRIGDHLPDGVVIVC